jgi:HD superfamily phosphohydrolase
MNSDFREIPELDELLSGRSLIRIPGELNVPFTSRVRALVDTTEFQRLASISQLGLVARVYPGARHTRFEHALGVFHNALRYLQQLEKDERFCSLVDRHSAEVLIAASLLHDLGHWPFCHPIEDLEIEGMPPHEAYASQFLAEGSELAEVLRESWHIEPDEILDLLSPRTDTPRMRLLRSILSGPIDVDKMDYLDRDSLHCGVPYGRHFDRQRLIQSLVVNAAGDGLAITAKGKTAAELMVFARYVMFSEVYWHHAVRSATAMFARAFWELSSVLPCDQLFRLSESEMISRLSQAARGTDCQTLVDGVFGTKRLLYKRLCDYSHYQTRELYERIAGRPYRDVVAITRRLIQLASQTCGVELGPLDLLIDAPPPHREVEFAIDVYFAKQDRFLPLRSVSPVVDALARTQFDDWVKRVRLFIHPARLEQVKNLPWDELVLQATDGL